MNKDAQRVLNQLMTLDAESREAVLKEAKRDHHRKPTTLAEDMAMLDEPLTSNGSMSMCYGDPYYARSLEKKYGAPIAELRRRVRMGEDAGREQ